ncbi:G-protein coupled receptor [Biomphalaria glabrata]|nr:putative G-protein coupled receptor [Biomphalaria glabrata]
MNQSEILAFYFYETTETQTSVILYQTDDVINDQLLYRLDVFLNCFLVQSLCVFGIVGNVINIIVLSYHGLQGSNIMLLSLSVTDLLGSVFRQVRRLKCLVATVDVPASVSLDTFGFVFFLLMDYWCLLLSIYLTTAIAIERCMAISAPFHVANVFTPWRVKIMLASLCVYSTVIMGPLCYRLTYTWALDPASNVTVAYLIYTQFYVDNMDILNTFTTIFHSNICTTLPLVIILICSLIIIFKLIQERPQTLKKLSSTRSSAQKKMKDRKAVKMLLFVCIATVFSCLPTAILAIYIIYFKTILLTGNLYYIFRSIEEVLYQFNASVNFIIYVSLSSKFKRIYKNLFLSCFYHSNKLK